MGIKVNQGNFYNGNYLWLHSVSISQNVLSIDTPPFKWEISLKIITVYVYIQKMCKDVIYLVKPFIWGRGVLRDGGFVAKIIYMLYKKTSWRSYYTNYVVQSSNNKKVPFPISMWDFSFNSSIIYHLLSIHIWFQRHFWNNYPCQFDSYYQWL